jgi:hypothetical protein
MFQKTIDKGDVFSEGFAEAWYGCHPKFELKNQQNKQGFFQQINNNFCRG